MRFPRDIDAQSFRRFFRVRRRGYVLRIKSCQPAEGAKRDLDFVSHPPRRDGNVPPVFFQPPKKRRHRLLWRERNFRL